MLLAKAKWVTPIGANKRQTTANPSTMDTSGPTAKRTTDEQVTDDNITDKRLKTNTGDKAATKTTPTPTPTAGPQGEQIIDLGGLGDCGWRAAPAAIAFGNSKDSQYTNSRLRGMSTTTRTKTIAWLEANIKEWQPFWATDPTANEATESGAVPTTAEAWLEALANRPFKWVDHYATAAMARATRFDTPLSSNPTLRPVNGYSEHDKQRTRASHPSQSSSSSRRTTSPPARQSIRQLPRHGPAPRPLQIPRQWTHRRATALIGHLLMVQAISIPRTHHDHQIWQCSHNPPPMDPPIDPLQRRLGWATGIGLQRLQ
jgi:hypothetical protein